MKKQKDYIFIDKTVFFPKSGILAVGDLHLGYELMLRQSGVAIPESQTKETIEDLKKIFSIIKEKGFEMKKIIFLGDIKHYFGFEFGERRIFDVVLDFLKKYFNEEDIILIKGNHDKMDYSGKKMKNYYIKDNVCFIHGHMVFPEIYDKKIKTIVMGHVHPSVIISDKANVKREKFKCFLVTKFQRKEIIVLPSFFEIIEGTSVNEYKEEYQKYFSILPKEAVLNAEIFVIGKDKVYDFGKVKNLD
ncbi:MAG: metallophosphoesterase [Candidatus Nanoarchaeia archaeon]